MNAAVESPPQAVDAAARGWQAALRLGYLRRGERTVLAERRHVGPLVVQRPFYPEGEGACHTILVHPPGGIAGGDELAVEVGVGEGAQALLTTPGAGKWYRSGGSWAGQKLAFRVATGGTLEWLPQETIVFDGARARLSMDVELASGAAFVGWEILCLGRVGSGERFSAGSLRLHTRVTCGGRPLWLERGAIEGGSPLLESPVGLAGKPVQGTLLVAAGAADASLLTAWREVHPAQGQGGVTALPGLLVARYLGRHGECAREYFSALWSLARPAVCGRPAITPRIWRT